MARVPYVNREEMDAAGQEIYDRIRNDRSSQVVGLQFRAMLHSPRAASFRHSRTLTMTTQMLTFRCEP